ncbi:STAS/SEC14 domain-containing protein [Pseudonocardia sp. MH-G8]|uniref:STAS/SEC14 domain-containing protein n=1 Tax=Pseudonocardia sp. MH-G8 TaxID=1854588 RepID=UPI000BA160F6|nr:STAS/SEC14 domain-containing protein [Pseudonocardia sp. MH-G8]OZM77243.1 STAS/SEC14 domain-containing protein [Pseudonocardia sp. MH-G8]
MLELMTETEGDVIAVRARGVLTEDDYRDVLVPQLAKALKGAEQIRVLFLLEQTFRGWNARAAWRNTCLDVRHRRDFDKVAIVGAPTWEQWCAKLANLLITGEIKTFAHDELSTAWTWLRA